MGRRWESLIERVFEAPSPTRHDVLTMQPHHKKYPRTPHLPWSPGATSDDAWSAGFDALERGLIVVTEKMDGENTTMYRDHIHARSLDSKHHPSRSWVKGLHQRIAHMIPEGWRICGENLYARHSIAYDELTSYFVMFSIWDDKNNCLSWDDTLEWAALLELEAPPVLYYGPWDEQMLRAITLDERRQEGYVVRTTRAFPYHEFAAHVAKWVRPNHVQTDEHWMHAQLVPNKLAAAVEDHEEQG
jgi:hypothetical protein